MSSPSSQRLRYAAAIGCGVFAALAVHIGMTAFGLGIDVVLRDGEQTNRQQLIAALAWWGIAIAGFIGGWATGVYLIAAGRGHEFVFRLARGFLIAIVVIVASVAGVLSKTGAATGTADLIASLTALCVGAVCALCGTRLAYLNAEQV